MFCENTSVNPIRPDLNEKGSKSESLADFLPATARVPLIGSCLHISFEGQSRGSENPYLGS
ncbi:hypothetical protein IC006_0735 [Sulfuracidifex tepidarius]|uniref:Uncharacterized protein n=1 Tax=Sulfuracidifex tepidarius TaxID=1294262 RepID=A0A510DTE3_9CREN|nr:hypothetical protein [Sulfuracidifex tepidarius]BBG23451.1 hypothetical protein IC006_0735 [Sulfuracidifex tepidarius]